MRVVKDWYAALSAREQLLVMLLGGVALAFIYAMVLLRPLQSWAEDAQTVARAAARDYAQISAQAAQIKAAQADTKTADTQITGNLVDILTRNAVQAGLSLSTIAPETRDSVRMVVKDVAAAQYLSWLQSLETELPVTVTLLEMQRTKPGLLSADLVVRDTRS